MRFLDDFDTLVEICIQNMKAISCSTTIFSVLWSLSVVLAQPGFLSIDCGGKANRTDPETKIIWVTDDNFIVDDGLKEDVNNSNSLPFYFQTVRVFPKPVNKSCYKLPLNPNIPHLLRVWFYGGTFNGLQQIPRFHYSIETEDMLSEINVPFENLQAPIRGERILVSSSEVLHICLIRTSLDDDMFISAIELRALNQGMYDMVKPGIMMRLVERFDLGAQSITEIRYPQDKFDRQWKALFLGGAQNVSSQEVVSINNTKNLPPTAVMQTAIASNLHSLHFPLIKEDISLISPTIKSFLLVLYFADLIDPAESRILNVLINNETQGYFRLKRNLFATEVRLECEAQPSSFIVRKASVSSGGPVINAYEYYQLFLTEIRTSSVDVKALAAINQRFNIKNWNSDPCFFHPWEGLLCHNSSSDVRVSEINLSRKNLTGSIPPAFSQLTELIQLALDNNHLTGSLPNLSSLSKLEILHLQNNNLSGEVPDWLSGLHNLKELFLDNNNFIGVIPQQLVDRLHTLKITYGGNRFLCMSKGKCQPSSYSSRKSKVSHRIGAIASGITLITLALITGILVFRRKKQQKRAQYRIPDYSTVLVPNPSKSRAFTLMEMVAATENFSHRIGQGGFGSVFWGKLQDGTQIAVKVLSLFSEHGIKQFLNEMDLLSRVHHKNLVCLVGYCNQSRELMLVYEYMLGGSLNDHLYGRNASKHPKLDWKSRLNIALDAAQGLEYLHVGCTPKIIHRDVKTANILLDAHLNAKLADFGLSRVVIEEEASHIFTAVRGTAGYLDPMYFSSHMLTEKSDVYSFGVVLLEIICGRRPVDMTLSEDKMNLVKLVTPYIELLEDSFKILEITDNNLDNSYNKKSVIHVFKLAMKCIGGEQSCRPLITEVIAEIKEAIKIENQHDNRANGEVSGHVSSNSDSTGKLTDNSSMKSAVLSDPQCDRH